MAKKNPNTPKVGVTQEDVIKTAISASDGVLDLARGKFTNVVVIGYTPNGGLDIASTSNRYEFLQHAFNRAIFELAVHERNALSEAQAKAQETTG